MGCDDSSVHYRERSTKCYLPLSIGCYTRDRWFLGGCGLPCRTLWSMDRVRFLEGIHRLLPEGLTPVLSMLVMQRAVEICPVMPQTARLRWELSTGWTVRLPLKAVETQDVTNSKSRSSSLGHRIFDLFDLIVLAIECADRDRGNWQVKSRSQQRHARRLL